MRRILSVASLVFIAACTHQPPGGISTSPTRPANPDVEAIVRDVSAARIEGTIRRLVAFGTRHTMSDTLSETRGIGAARRWIRSVFDSISLNCGGCLEVQYVADIVPQSARITTPTNVVSVVAVQRGQTDPDRIVIITGHFDSRNSTANDNSGDAPGADDDGSGTAAVLEAARVLSSRRFAGTIIYAALAGEEQGLLGGTIVARWVKAHNFRVVGNLNNDIVGNTLGLDSIADDRTVRVFSDGVPPTETDAERTRRRGTGGEVDGISRQLARYVQQIGNRYVRGLDVMTVYRHDRYGRGGDHRAFADLGYPAVRITEAHENWTRQHQNIRTENGINYGDVPDMVNYTYAAKVAALNAASLASLAWAPAPPREVRIAGGNRPSTTLSWQTPEDSADVAGYRVYWRRTDSPTWDYHEDVGITNRHEFHNVVIDNWYFGVASVSRDGHESTVVFPSGAPAPAPAGGGN